uniref:C2 domain-containing protein n=1 Tax=Ananas comosus var. bracteatus TaxID=296719 RepID=A0A6V7PZX3_ANACO|nr:unnamed protein product [Ananas comosus var. bracteatus]
MRLYVYVLEARGLPPPPPSDPNAATYAKLKVGRRESRTRAVGPALRPVWNEEFVFRLDNDDGSGSGSGGDGDGSNWELEVGVFRQLFEAAGGREFMGRVRLPVARVLDEEPGRHSLPRPTWFSLQPKHRAPKDCGALLSFNFHPSQYNTIQYNTIPGLAINYIITIN